MSEENKEEVKPLPKLFYRVASFEKGRRLPLVKMLRDKTKAGIKDCKELLENGLPYSLTEETVQSLEAEGVVIEPCNALKARFLHTQHIQKEMQRHASELTKLGDKLDKINRFHF
jgi:ribosomal protein L7/L12